MLTFRDPCGNELGAKNADKKLTADPERSEGLLAIFGLGNRTCKPNFVRSMNAAGRSFLWATHYCGAQATYPEVLARRAGTPPQQTRRLARKSLPIWSCSVWGLPCPAHYCDSGALLPHLFTLT